VEGASGHMYYVQLLDGDVHRVTLDQLDEAFQAGHIDASTLVLADGAERWTTLGRLAGIDDPPPLDVGRSRPRSVPPAPPMAPAQVYAARPPPPPATRVVLAPMNFIAGPSAPVFHSQRPVSIDLSELTLDAPPYPASRRRRWIAALAAVAIVGCLGGVVLKRPSWAQPYLSRVGFHAESPTAAAAQASPVAVLPPVTAPPPPSATAATTQLAVPSASALTDNAQPGDTTKKAGAPHANKAKLHRAVAPTRNPHGAPPPKVVSTPLSTGGGKYDPLSSSI
jgi:hypothetical protein